MSITSKNRLLLESKIPELQQNGYQVFLEPSSGMLPTFLKGYRPDAIAVRDDKGIVIEIIRDDDADNSKRIERLNDLFKDQTKWKLNLLYDRSLKSEPSLPAPSRPKLEARLLQIKKLTQNSHYEAALLMCWSVFEGLSRVLVPARFDRPQSPLRIVNVLSEEGHLLREEAEFMRRMSLARNNVIHGGFEFAVSKDDVDQFVSIIEYLLHPEPNSSVA